MLKAVIAALDERGVTFVACDVHAPVLVELKRDGLLDTIGPENLFASAGEALKAYNALPERSGAADTCAGDPLVPDAAD